MPRLEWKGHPLLSPAAWRRAFTILAEYRPLVTRQRGPLAAALLCVLGGAAVRIARPWPLKILFDDMLIPMATGTGAAAVPWMELGMLCGAVLGLGLLASAFGYGELVFAAAAGQRIATSLRRRLFGHLLLMPLGVHRGARRGEHLNLLTGDIALLRELLVNLVLGVFSSVVIIAAMIAIMIALNAGLALVCLAVLPLVVLTAVNVSSTMRRTSRRQREQEGALLSSAQETLQALPVVKLFGQEAFERRRFAGINRKSLRSGLRMKRLQAVLLRNVEALLAVGTCIFLAAGVFEVHRGRLSPGELLVFASYLRSFQKPLRKLADIAARAAKASACGERIREVLETPAEPGVPATDEALPADPPGITRELRLEGIRFDYGNGVPVIAELNASIPRGSKVAVVGPSGAGKTTLLLLLAGLFEPASGRILWDDEDLTGENRRLREGVTAVFQEPYLFHGTIAENLAYGQRDADPARLLAAAEGAGAREFVERLPGGLEAKIGEQGLTLSGGQRQRLAVARAMLRDASLVLLDEPTTGLDEGSRREVLRGLEALTRSRTSFWSTHDPELVEDATMTIALGHGEVRIHAGPPRASEMQDPGAAAPVSVAG